MTMIKEEIQIERLTAPREIENQPEFIRQDDKGNFIKKSKDGSDVILTTEKRSLSYFAKKK